MFRKSFIVVLIQVSGAILGVLSIYLIAGDMAPEVYSLVGVYGILSGITLTFTDLGVETTMIREALYWIKNGENEKVVEYTTQAIVSRALGFFILLPFLIIYLLFIYYEKYEGRYFFILMTFLAGAEISSLNDAMSLVVRSQGGYIFSQFIKTINTYFLKFVGIILYFWKGEQIYLIFYSVSSIPLFLVFIIKLKKYFKMKYVKLKPTIKKIYEARYLWLRTDLDYFKTSADSFLVSTIFPPTIMGSYTIYKNLEGMSRTFIEGFFDVLTQNLTKYKGNEDILLRQEKKIKLARNIIIGLVVIGILVYSISPEYFVKLINLSQYKYMEQMMYCVAFVSVIYLIGKFELNILSLFATSKLNFWFGVVIFLVSIISFLVVGFSTTVYMILLQRFIAYGFTSILAIILFQKYKDDLYLNFYH